MAQELSKGELVEALLKPKEIQIVKGLEIRDTALHESEIADVSLYNIQTLSIINELDQAVTIQIKGNWTASKMLAVDIGTAFDVATGNQEARTLTPDTTGWFPFIYVTLRCAVAPTKGAVWVRVIAKPI